MLTDQWVQCIPDIPDALLIFSTINTCTDRGVKHARGGLAALIILIQHTTQRTMCECSMIKRPHYSIASKLSMLHANFVLQNMQYRVRNPYILSIFLAFRPTCTDIKFRPKNFSCCFVFYCTRVASPALDNAIAASIVTRLQPHPSNTHPIRLQIMEMCHNVD